MSSGCDHYIRRCSLLAPCCKKYYNCRLCHNDKESHELDRKTVEVLKCLQCDSSQEVRSHCKDCGIKFGRYYCEICRLFDDTEKGQFHCSGCGICRVGGKENFFHCDRCDMCLGIQLKDSHKCVEKSSRSDCPICYEDIHTSRIPAHVPSCGHLLHSSCFTKLLESGGYACPICNKSLINMTRMWRTLDLEISQTPMPEEYREFYVLVLCRDCNKKSKVKFHVLGLKCMECGSYNTSREGEEGVPVVPRPAIGDPAADNEDGWETEEEEEILGGEEEPATNGNETRQQQDDSISDELNIADVVINVDGDRDSVLPLDCRRHTMKPFACSLNLIELKIVNKKLPQGLQTKAAKQMSLGEKIIFLTVSAPPRPSHTAPSVKVCSNVKSSMLHLAKTKLNFVMSFGQLTLHEV